MTRWRPETVQTRSAVPACRPWDSGISLAKMPMPPGIVQAAAHADEGDEPFELTGGSIRCAPFVTPIISTPVASGGTPPRDRLLKAGRLLTPMPFPFPHKGHLGIVLREYDPVTDFRRKVDLHAVATSASVLKARLAANRHRLPRAVHRVNAWSRRWWLGAFRNTLEGLQRDPHFLEFHRGDADVLPSSCADEHRPLLGKYAELAPIEECQPYLAGQGAMPHKPMPGVARARSLLPAE
jgi:hypothetical protein